jgi:TolB-like protein/tRNA A-37 threonylcarbamoyl transferase component Bud32/Tfp pilus assembly protein PilF
MTITCPKCQHENPDNSIYCGKCTTPLKTSEKAPKQHTETLEALKEELTTGSTFAERYQIIEELGKGGMGKVYKAIDTEIKEKIAVKLLKPEISADQNTIERFQNEMKLARQISHKNVCRMYHLGKDEGSYYITMEYVSGEDLKSMIRMTKHLSVGAVLSIGKQICEGLAEAHSLSIVHRDLKPQNIMIDKGGNVKVMDFGIARSLREKGITGSGVMIGTPEYMSPEQAEAKDIDLRTDIYSFGVILYEMATGRAPFEGDTALSIAMKHKGEIPQDPKELNPNISDDLCNVIQKCLEKDKKDRYQSADEILTELDNVEKGIPTTERIIPEKKPLTSKEITVTFGLKKLLVPALIFIGIIIVGLVIWQAMPEKEVVPVGPTKPSIAVLPFQDLSPEKNQEYFCDGLAESIINALTKVKDLRVPARASSFSFKGKERDIQEIGNRLNVNTILEGSVQKAGNRIRITAQLIKVADESHLWSEQYDRDLDDVFSIQDNITFAIIDKLKVELLGNARDNVVKRYTNSREAYDSYLRGQWIFNNKFTAEDWKKAISHYNRAIEIDPNFSLAYVGLALIHTSSAFYDFISPNDAIPKYKDALYHALMIDNELPEAIGLSGYARFRFEWDWSGAEAEMKRALELNPNVAVIHRYYAKFLMAICQIDQALDEYLISLEIDPSIFAQSEYAMFLYYARRYDDAIKLCKKLLEIDPDYPLIHYFLGACYVQKPQFQEAISSLEKSVELSGRSTELLANLAYCYAASGNKEKALGVLEELNEQSAAQYVSSIFISPVYALLQDNDKAFELLELAYKERDPDLIWLKVDPYFDVIRSDPRYEAMLKKLGLSRVSE